MILTDQEHPALEEIAVQRIDGQQSRRWDHAASAPRISAADVMCLAVWTAVVTGMVEAMYCAFQKYYLGQFLFCSTSVFWMGPVAQLALFTLLAGPLAVLAWRTPRLSVFTAAVTLFSFVAFLNWLMLLAGLHLVAQILVALGLALQAGHIAQAHAETILRLVRRTVPCLVAGVMGLALSVEGIPRFKELQAVRALGPAPRTAPNVLLVVLDTVRADALNLSREDGHTPCLKRVADEGTTFARANAPAPWTLPSHASMLTGRFPHELSAGWHAPLDDRFPTLAYWLRQRGYQTAGFVGNTRYCSAETGLSQGFLHYEDYRITPITVALATALGRRVLALSYIPLWLGSTDAPARVTAEDINNRFLRWLDRRADRPFFALVNYFDAHDPYVPPPQFARRAAKRFHERKLIRTWWGADKLAFSHDQIEYGRGAYEDCIRYLDAQLGALLDELDQRAILNNTILVITSDHGEQFGDHDLFGHGASLYQPALHVPLVVRWPDHVPRGRRMNAFVSLADLPISVAKWIDPQSSAPFPGQPLDRYWESADSASSLAAWPVVSRIAAPARHPPCQGRSPVFRGPMDCIIVGSVKYIRNGDGAEEVYDLSSDPAEQINLAHDSTRHAEIRQLRESLDHILQTHPVRDKEAVPRSH
jgi:arylsulfatase A-like enzyme